MSLPTLREEYNRIFELGIAMANAKAISQFLRATARNGAQDAENDFQESVSEFFKALADLQTATA